MDEVDPELREMFDKLGISLEQKRLSGVAVDAIVDSVRRSLRPSGEKPRRKSV
jgi:hypothetical protein